MLDACRALLAYLRVEVEKRCDVHVAPEEPGFAQLTSPDRVLGDPGAHQRAQQLAVTYVSYVAYVTYGPGADQRAQQLAVGDNRALFRR